MEKIDYILVAIFGVVAAIQGYNKQNISLLKHKRKKFIKRINKKKKFCLFFKRVKLKSSPKYIVSSLFFSSFVIICFSLVFLALKSLVITVASSAEIFLILSILIVAVYCLIYSILTATELKGKSLKFILLNNLLAFQWLIKK